MSNLIFIRNDLINKLDDDELCVYLAMKYIAKQDKKCFITYGHIDYVLFGREATKAEKEIVSSGFKKVVNKGLVSVSYTIRKYGYVCNTENLNVYKQSLHYTSLTNVELQKIMLIGGCNRYNLLKYFITLISTFAADVKMDGKYRFKVGYMPRTHLSTTTGIDIGTIDRYNKILEDNNLIYITNRQCYDGANQIAVWKTNVYSRYQDAELCEQYARENSDIAGTTTRKQQVNDSRKYVQMYNAMLKGKEYDNETTVAIYAAMKNWNEEKLRKYNEQLDLGYRPPEPKYKDLSIFDKYQLD